VNVLDAELLPVGGFASALLDLDSSFDEADVLSIERVVCQVPIELAVRYRDDGSEPAVLVSPPRQPIVTSVMPVFHGLQITVVQRGDD
jgi:hypothetical protein